MQAECAGGAGGGVRFLWSLTMRVVGDLTLSPSGIRMMRE